MRAVDQSDGRSVSAMAASYPTSLVLCVCVSVCAVGVILVQTSSITAVLHKATFIVSTEGQSSAVA